MLRHERQTVAMALAEQLHHSANRVERDAALRRQTTRAREGEVREEHHAPRGQTRPLPEMRPGSGSGAATAGGDPAARGDRLRAGSRPRRAADGGTVWWKSLHPRPQFFKLHRQQWGILPQRPQCSKLFSPVVVDIAPAPAVTQEYRLWWRVLHPRLQLSMRQRQWWSILFQRQR